MTPDAAVPGRPPLLRPSAPPVDRSEPVTVSAVIVTWNSRQQVLDCLSSLVDNPPTVPWEVIVVDNASTDGTPAAVRAGHPGVRVIVNGENRGLPAANNQGMVAARGDFFLISNPDVLWRPGAVDALLDVAARHPRAAWIVPRLLYDDGVRQTSAGELPTIVDALAGRQLERLRHREGVTTGQWWDAWDHDEEREIGRGMDAAYLVPRRAVEDVGLQDEGYWLDWEGLDWTARFRDAGWEVWLSPGAEAVHLGGASIRQVPFRSIVSSHRGMYRYFAARNPAAARPVLGALIAARAGVKLMATAAGAALYQRAYRPDKPT